MWAIGDDCCGFVCFLLYVVDDDAADDKIDDGVSSSTAIASIVAT